MKLSIPLSAILVVLPALVAASAPLEVRALNGDGYMPRRRWWRGGQWQGSNQRGSGPAVASAAAKNKNKSQSSTSVAASTTDAALHNQGKHRGHQSSGSTTTAAAAADTSAAASTTTDASTTDASTTVASTTDTSTTDTSNAASTTTAAGAAASVASANNNTNNPNDPNTSLTLLSSLVETGLEQNGQAVQEAGQVPSLTSSNNFINFCAGQTITNGQQITTGSCNPIPMGDIPAKVTMPNCKFTFPKNFSNIPANQPFTIEMALNNLQAGVFTNAQQTYYMAPQQLNGQGVIIGHTHFVIQAMGNFNDPTILDPTTFAFFKGVDTAQNNGVVSVNVTAGVPAGNYRLASINTDANHVPVIVAVAQHGSLDDMVYFTAQ